MRDRQKRLLELIERATGNADHDADTLEAEMTVPAT
jgi:hypothetical protein